MNERIRELAEQAEWRFADRATGNFSEYDRRLEKFAELIVKECVRSLSDNTPVLDEYESQEDWDRGYGQAMRDCVHYIQEHFGVEE